MRLVRETPGGARLGDFLIHGLSSDATSFRGAVAFVRTSGIAHLSQLIADFSRHKPFELIAGVDLQGTSLEGLRALLAALGAKGTAYIFYNAGPHTFHPKLYCFTYPDRIELYVGSGNMTRGGLFTNHEVGIQLTIRPDTHGGEELYHQVEAALDSWSINGGPASRKLDHALIEELSSRGLILPEANIRASTASSSSTSKGAGALFGSVTVPSAPPVPLSRVSVAAPPEPTASDPLDSSEGLNTTNPRFFVMTLQQTDVGRGQTTKGAAARSPEVFIPLAARDQHPDFWGWAELFEEDDGRPGKFDRVGVPFFIGGQASLVNMMTWPVKHDFRLRSEALRSAGAVGDILQLERSAVSGGAYIADIIPKASIRHAELLQRCNQAVRPPSTRRFGYF